MLTKEEIAEIRKYNRVQTWKSIQRINESSIRDILIIRKLLDHIEELEWMREQNAK